MLDQHRGAFEHDWRTRLHLSTGVIGDEMTWGEAYRHVEALSIDPSSHIAAALAGWDYPVDRVALAVMNLYDLQHEIAWVQGGKKGKKPRPHSRPWPDMVAKTTSPGADVTHEQIVAALRFAGHTAELPS